MRFPTAAVLSYTLLAFGNVSQAALHPPFYLQVYDDVLDISWMQDTNFVQTSCFANNALWQAFDLTTIANNSGRSKAQICSDGGALNWYEAEAWIAHLNANNYLGVNTWRQWAVPDPTNDTTCDLQNAGGTDIDWGYNCTASELGHLFNVTLGNPNNLDSRKRIRITACKTKGHSSTLCPALTGRVLS